MRKGRSLGVCAVSAAFAAAALAPAASAAQPRGHAGVVIGHRATLAQALSTSITPTRPIPARVPPRTTAPQAAHPAPLASLPGPAPSTSLVANFDGTSSLDSEITNFGQRFEPPDQGLCVGNGFVVEMVNSAYTIYRPDGTVVQGPLNVNGPFNEGLREFTSDPRCHYDPTTNTWYAVILFLNQDFTRSTLDVSVSNTGDPTKLWTTYRVDTTARNDANHRGCPCFLDQPRIGIDQNNIYVSGDDFSINGPQFNGAEIYAIAKSDLVGDDIFPDQTPAHFAHFEGLTVAGQQAFGIQPAISYGKPNAEYFLSGMSDPTTPFDQRIAVWAMTNRAAVATGGVPKLSKVVIASEGYGEPPQAPQKGSSTLIDSGDSRMQQVQWINGTVWGELDTALTLPNDTQTRAGAAWFQVKPGGLSNGAITKAQILRQGYVGLAGNYLLYPAVVQTQSGTAVMGFSITGPDRFPSVGYAVLGANASDFGPVQIAANGTGPYHTDSPRWGDYSWATLAPGNRNTAWFADEYVPPLSRQTTTRQRNWGTRVFAVDTTP